MTGNHWTVIDASGGVVACDMPLSQVENYISPERFARGWCAVFTRIVSNQEQLDEVSTARGTDPEEDSTPPSGVPADGNLRTAIEEALASLECGMVAGAIETLREALESP